MARIVHVKQVGPGEWIGRAGFTDLLSLVVADGLGVGHALVTQLELPRLVVLGHRPSMLSILCLVFREG